MGVWIEILKSSTSLTSSHVTPFVGVWIEISARHCATFGNVVTPFVGVWIEIAVKCFVTHWVLSLPSWECGLKYLDKVSTNPQPQVTPFVGVWIEMNVYSGVAIKVFVTPFVGVWIEIQCAVGMLTHSKQSLPSWECGLKSLTYDDSLSYYESLPSWECGLK